jgi:hypothetical protein
LESLFSPYNPVMFEAPAISILFSHRLLRAHVSPSSRNDFTSHTTTPNQILEIPYLQVKHSHDVIMMECITSRPVETHLVSAAEHHIFYNSNIEKRPT